MTKRFFLFFFAGLLLIRPFSDGLTYPAAQNLFQFAILTAAVLYLALLFAGRVAYQTTGLELPAAAFLLISFAAVIGSASPYRSTVVYLQYLYYFSLFFLLSQVIASPSLSPLPGGEKVKRREVDDRRLILTIILFTAVLVSLYGIQQYFWGFKDTLNYLIEHNLPDKMEPGLLARITNRRVFSTFVYPNVFAAFLIALLPIAFSLAAAPPKSKKGEIPADKLFGILLLLIFGFTLALTKSSGAIMTIFLVFLLWLAYLWTKRVKRYYPYLILFGGFLFLFLVLNSLQMVPHILSLRDRFFYWASSLEIFKQRPVLGFGPGSFGVQYARFKIPAAMETQHSHSIFFEILAEGGILGIATFLWFWVLLFRKTWKGAATGLQKGIFWGTLALFLHNQIDFDFADPSLATYLFILPALIPLSGLNSTGLIPLKTAAIPAGKRNERRRRSLTQFVSGLIILILLTAGFHLAKIHRAEKIYQNGLALLSAGDGSRGLTLLRNASEINPGNPAYYAQLGALFYRAGEAGKNQIYFQKSAYAYQKACKAEPYSASFRFRLGLSAESAAEITGDPRWALLAEQSFRDAVFLYPTKEEYLEKLKTQGVRKLGTEAQSY